MLIYQTSLPFIQDSKSSGFVLTHEERELEWGQSPTEIKLTWLIMVTLEEHEIKGNLCPFTSYRRTILFR